VAEEQQEVTVQAMMEKVEILTLTAFMVQEVQLKLHHRGGLVVKVDMHRVVILRVLLAVQSMVAEEEEVPRI